MRAMVTISAFGPDAAAADELRERLTDIFNEFGLSGEIKGMGYEMFASFHGSFTNEVKTRKEAAGEPIAQAVEAEVPSEEEIILNKNSYEENFEEENFEEESFE